MAIAMDYFRRPMLAGNNLQRTRFAIIHGSKRRSDPDINSEFPYFPDVNAGDTLSIKVQGTTYVVTLTSNVINTIIQDINTVLGANGFAFDSDGCIGLQSKTVGYSSFIAVVAGNAADALGFDLISQTQIWAKGGDLPSAPQGRAENPFGTAFPRKGENFTVEAVNRVAGRLAANMDVLYFDHVRGDEMMQYLTDVEGVNNPTTLTITPSDTPIYNGYGKLTGASTPEDLVSSFLLIDPVTKLVAASRVVGVTLGIPATIPPPLGGYADTAGWGANDGGNVLGVSLQKVTGAAISEVRDGRVLVVPTGDFVGQGVIPGDFLEISGATNTSPWSHNGRRWVVEEVRGADAVAVRPMSASEVILAGTVLDEKQPVVELNGEKESGEVFGTVTVWTGAYTNRTTLVFDPPIPPGATYELWTARPRSIRDSQIGDRQDGLNVLYRDLIAQVESVPNGSIEGLEATHTAPNVTVAQGKIRWNGKVYDVPQRVFTPGEFPGPAGDNYIYWDDKTSSVKALSSPDFKNLFTGAGGHLIAKVNMAAGAVNYVVPAAKLLGERVKHVTVGLGGQFEDLRHAANHLNEWYSAWSSGNPAGTLPSQYPHVEIEVLSNQLSTASATFTVPSVRIRASTPGTILSFGGSEAFVFQGDGRFVLEDFDLDAFSVIADRPLVKVDADCDMIALRNLRMPVSTKSYSWLVAGTGIGITADDILIENCQVRLGRGVSALGLPSNGRLVCVNNSFTYDVNEGFGSPQLFSNFMNGALAGSQHFIDKNLFSDWTTADNSNPMIIGSAASNGLFFTNNTLQMGTFALGSGARMITASGSFKSVVTGNRCTTPVPRFFFGSSNESICSHNHLIVRPNGVDAAVIAGTAHGNTILVAQNSAPGAPGTALQISKSAIGNDIDSYDSQVAAATAIAVEDGVGSGVQIIGNRCYANGNTGSTNVIYCNDPDASIIGNWVVVDGLNTSNSIGIFLDEGSGGTVVSGNRVWTKRGRGIVSFTHGPTSTIINANHVYDNNVAGAVTNLIEVIYSGSGTINLSIVSNNMLLGSSNITNAIFVGSNATAQVHGNFVNCPGSCLSSTSFMEAWNNRFQGTVSLTGGCLFQGNLVGGGCDFSGSFNVTSNSLGGVVGLGAASLTQPAVFSNNTVQSVFSVGSNGTLIANGNSILGQCDLSTFTSNLTFQGNTVGGNGIFVGWTALGSNFFASSVSLTGATASQSVTNNVFQSTFTSNSPNTTTLFFTGNVVSGAWTQSGVCPVEARSNRFNSTVSFKNGLWVGNSIVGNFYPDGTQYGTGASDVTCYSNFFSSNVSLAPNTVFVQNTVAGSVYSSPTITSAEFSGNRVVGSLYGGVSPVVSGSLLISNSAIGGNIGTSAADPLDVTGGAKVFITGCFVAGNFYAGPSHVSNCHFAGAAEFLPYISGSNDLIHNISNSHFASSTGVASNATFTSCNFVGGVNNINLVSIWEVRFANCRFEGAMDMRAETVTHIYLSNCDFDSTANVELGMQAATGVGNTTAPARVYVSNCRIPGELAIEASGCVMVMGCTTGNLRVRGTHAGAGITISGNEILGSGDYDRGFYKFVGNNCNGFQGFGSAANAARVQMTGNFFIAQVQLYAVYRSSVVGNYFEVGGGGGSALVANGPDGLQIVGNWIFSQGGTACIYVNAAAGAVVRGCTWVLINSNFLQQNQADGNTTNCVRLDSCINWQVKDNFAYKPHNGAVLPIWLRVEGNCSSGYIGGNWADSGDGGWNCEVQIVGGAFHIFWYSQSTNVHDTLQLNEHTQDGGVTRGAVYIN